jgi:LuxR family maltose regulon positive regulatory protein
LRALAAAYQGDVQRSAALAHRALELLPEDNLLLRGFAIGSLGLSYLWSEDLNAAVRTFEEGARIGEKVGNVMFTVLALRRVGRLRMAQGRLHEAKAIFERALELGVDRQGRRLPIAGMVLIGLGYVYREWNDLEAATRYITDGIELAQKTSAAMLIGAHIMLARIKHAQGDEAGAREMMQKAGQLAAQTQSTVMDDLGVALSQTQLWIAQGDLEPALAWAESRRLNKDIASLAQEINGDSISSMIRRYEMLVLARLMIVQSRTRDALTLLDLVLARMGREGRIETVIEIQMLRALAFQAAGDSAQALAAIERALTLAEPSGYIRTFADEGERMRLLISDFRNSLSRGLQIVNQKLCSYADRLLAAFDHAPSLRSPRAEIRHLQSEIVEPLSEREIEVLRLLAAGQSNPEIAQALYVAVSTVRSHAKSIYGKLNVHGRWEAVQRAKELGLL